MSMTIAPRTRRLAVAVLAAALASTLVITSVARWERERLQQRFDHHVAELGRAITADLDMQEEAITALAAFIRAAPSLDAAGFAVVAQALTYKANFLHRLSWYQVTGRAADARPVRLRHTEPPDADLLAQQVDLSAQPPLGAALAQAEKSGGLAATGRTRQGWQIFAPVRSLEGGPAGAVTGFVSAAVAVGDLVRFAVAALERSGDVPAGLVYRLVDASALATEQRVFDTGTGDAATEAADFAGTVGFEFGQRVWRLEVRATPQFAEANASPAVRLAWIVCLLVSGLAVGLVMALTRPPRPVPDQTPR